MDLNPSPNDPMPAVRPRVMRLPTSNPVEVDLDVFEGGEAITEDAPVVEDEPEEENRTIWTAEHSMQADLEAEERESEYAAQQRALQAQAEAYREHLRENYHERSCPLPACDTVVRVAKGEDHGDVLGLGMSMADAQQLESYLIEHLESHTLGEWMAALQKYEEALKGRFTSPGIVVAPEPVEGIIPGPSRRDPARQAAVDALDARLGRSRPAPSPEAAADRDERIRAERARRREEARQPTPFDLTPRFDGDPRGEMGGIVTIKR